MKGIIGLIVALAIAVSGFMWYKSNEAEKDRKAKIEAAEAAARAKVEAEAKAKQEAAERAAKAKAEAEAKAKREKAMAKIKAEREKSIEERKEANQTAILKRKLESLKRTLKRDKAILNTQLESLRMIEQKLKHPENYANLANVTSTRVKKYAAQVKYYKEQDEKIREKMYSHKDDRKRDLAQNKTKYNKAVINYKRALNSYKNRNSNNQLQLKQYISSVKRIYEPKLQKYKLDLAYYNAKLKEYKELKKQLKNLDNDDDLDKEPASIAAAN